MDWKEFAETDSKEARVQVGKEEEVFVYVFSQISQCPKRQVLLFPFVIEKTELWDK